MKDNLDAGTLAAISSREGIAPAYFLWIEARNRENGALETMGLWSGWDAVTADVIDRDTGTIMSRPYQAGGSIVGWPAIPLEIGIVPRTIRIRLSQVNAAVQIAFRGYDPKHAPVQLHLGFMDIATMRPVGPAEPVFVGRVNGAPISTPAAGGEGGIELACVSDTRELTRTNPLKRSDEMQKRRLLGGNPDRFRRYSDVAGGWLQNIHWGEVKGKAK